MRGWIDPDDRLWRHPSEVARASGSPVASSAGDMATGTRIHRHRGQLMVVVAATAAMAAAAAVVILLSPASDKPQVIHTAAVAADAPMTTLAVAHQGVPTVAQAAGQSMVQLRVGSGRTAILLTGVAVAEGGLVATAADALKGKDDVSMIGTDGHPLPAKLVAIDRNSDVALIEVPDDVPVAPFADDTSLRNGSPDLALTLAGSSSGVPVLRCQPGQVSAVGATVSDGPANGMPAIMSSTLPAGAQAGEPLLNIEGEVIGLLYDDDRPSTGTSGVTFLPSELVLGVADDLRSTGKVTPGGLGIKASTSAVPAGADVLTVPTDSPAAGALQPGEVIVGMDSVPVRSWADLEARLYVLAPQTPVTLSVFQGSTPHVVEVVLGPSS
jgi:S1-C subfamily serine protease